MTSVRAAVPRRAFVGGLLGTLAAPAIVHGEGGYPNRTVRYINPYPAGGPTDTLSRRCCA